MQKTYCTSASVMCANKLYISCRQVQVLVHMHSGHSPRTDGLSKAIAMAQNGQPGMQESLTNDHVFLFLTIWNFEVEKLWVFFFFCGNMQIYLSYFFFIYLRIQGFQLLKLMVSAPTPYETFHFTTVFHLSFKSLLNSCPKWILQISRYWVNS